MKNQILLLLLIIVTAFLFCVPSVSVHKQSTPRRTPENIKKYCDSLQRYNDSIDIIFQKESFNPKRTTNYMRPILDSLSKEITENLNNSTAGKEIRAKSIFFIVLPSGQIKFRSFSDFPKSDTNLCNDTTLANTYCRQDSVLQGMMDKVAEKYRTDSIPNYKSYFGLKGVVLNNKPSIKFTFKDTSFYATHFTGGRSKASIMKIVLANLPLFKKAYDNALRMYPGIKGKITVKFAIDENGYVIYSKVLPFATTIGLPVLEKKFENIIFQLQFSKIDNRGDITEVIYPFILSQ